MSGAPLVNQIVVIARGALLALLAMLLLAGCGAADPRIGEEPAAGTDAVRVPSGEEGKDGEQPMPSRGARAAGRSFDALVTAYAPVSERINFLVAAEHLREAAELTGVSDEVEEERFGAVRLEAQRMRRVLRSTRSEVEAVTVTDIDQKRVQDLMLGAIDARARAMVELTELLDALVDPEIPDAETRDRERVWRASWNQSLRMAREATTTMQQSRARLGLAPAPEESIR